MSKDKKNKKKFSLQDYEGKRENASTLELLEATKLDIEKQIKRETVLCPHTKKNGKVSVEFIHNGNGDAICTKCHTRFNMVKVSHEELTKSIKVLHNAINQIKAMTTDPIQDEDVIKLLGTLDYNLAPVDELYARALGENTKNKKKNKNKNYDNYSNYGSYGSSEIDFLSGNKKRKW